MALIDVFVNILLFIVIPFTLAITYLCYFINRKVVSKILFVFCLIYLYLFIVLNFLVIFDMVICYNDDKDEDSKIFISYFYYYFNRFSLALRYLIFPFFIGYTKSGYYRKWRRCIDAIFYHYILLIIGFILSILGIIIFFIFKEQLLKLYGNFDFTYFNYLNFIGFLQIYMEIGFFIAQILFEMRRKKSDDLTKNILLL